MAVATSSVSLWFDPMAMALNQKHSPGLKPDQVPKRHAACDECRNRKLKCSGETSGCSRCVKHRLVCHYSIQKQMGRPPKARARKVESSDTASASPDPYHHGYTPDPSESSQAPFFSSPDPAALHDASNLCPGPYRSYMASNCEIRPGPFVTSGPLYEQSTPMPYQPHQAPPPLPVCASPPTSWPDYSNVSASGLLSHSSPQSSLQSPNFHDTSSLSTTQENPQCTCLSYLYLCLSSLSTLSTFPLGAQSLETLYTAARTAQEVIRCEICPQAFNTCTQNLMLLGTLLSVVADGWLRISRSTPEELGHATVTPSFIAALPSDAGDRRAKWADWLHHVVRHGVAGSDVVPTVNAVQAQCLEAPSLLSLVEELEARQHRWHAASPPSLMHHHHHQHMHNRDAGTTEQQHQERDYLCLRIIGQARNVIAQIGFPGESGLAG
ncbi:hypothetical protein AJ80_04219 [Polytolypa hystricis UAMH7299]|uniref:Zn(2)-C6 fungal-type domain-containing protein n=1 Tax=Polytolypa hystricis (strain UAMH7299) TaxID=1447883 RepID=A0A2B7YDK5_POLH7|nr:hypothetical protein AJ80_04219 [Polytolypa hystricis UAMH7299]